MNLRNMRDSRELKDYNQKLAELKTGLAARGLIRSGHFMKQSSDLQKQAIDLTVHGYIEDALATCDLYDVPLTKELCTSLEDIARASLSAKYGRGPYIQAIMGNDWPAVAMNQLNQEWERDKLKSMPTIIVMLETARIADARKRTEAMANKAPKQFAVGTKVRVRNPGVDGIVTEMGTERAALSEYWHKIDTSNGVRREPGCNLELIPEPITQSGKASGNTTNYIQHVTQSGPGSSVSQLGDTHTNILQIGDMRALEQELAAIRAALKAQPDSLEADVVLGSLASAERAAQSNDGHGVKHALSMITKGGWEIVEKVAPAVGSQVLLHYLKLHGLA